MKLLVLKPFLSMEDVSFASNFVLSLEPLTKRFCAWTESKHWEANQCWKHSITWHSVTLLCHLTIPLHKGILKFSITTCTNPPKKCFPLILRITLTKITLSDPLALILQLQASGSSLKAFQRILPVSLWSQHNPTWAGNSVIGNIDFWHFKMFLPDNSSWWLPGCSCKSWTLVCSRQWEF